MASMLSNTTNSTQELLPSNNLSSAFSITLAACFVCIMLGGIVFNLILIYTICMNAGLHTIKNYFIVNLAVCDLLRAVATLPFEPDVLIRGYFSHGTYLCGWKETVFVFSLPSSIINMLLLTSERLLILLYPLHYRKYITKRKVAAILFLSWLYFVLVAVYPFIADPNAIVIEDGICFVDFSLYYAFFQVVVNFTTPLLFILIMNCFIFRIAARAMETQRRLSNNSNNTRHNKFFSNYRAAKTIMIIVTNVSACWLAYIIIVTVNFACGTCHSPYVTYIGKAINCTSVATNPILYGLLNTSIRNIIIGTYRRLCCVCAPSSSSYHQGTSSSNGRPSFCAIVRQKWKKETVTSLTSTFLLDHMDDKRTSTQF